MSEPAILASAAVRAAGSDPLPTCEEFKILVVDDNPADRLMYRILLPNSGERTFGITEAESSEAALVACKAQRPDCILLDFNLPNMDGLEFMAAVKAEFEELPFPIVMLTGVRDERTAVRAMKLGAADYIPKSDNLAEVLERAIVGAIEKFRMRRQIQEQGAAVAASELQHRVLLEALPQLVWVADVEGVVEYANRRWCEYTGLLPENTIRMRDAVHTDDRDRYWDGRRRAVTANVPFESEVRLMRASDRSYRWHLIRVAPMKDSNGETGKLLGTGTDIEDLKRAERALQQKQKWESIGLLAGGIAHDFNNLLVGILGGASFAADFLPQSHPVQPMLDNIVKSGERAAQLTQQMLAYSGQGHFVIERLDLSAAVKETSQLVRAMIPQNVRLTIQAADSLPLIETDAGQIQQVIMNLIINAAESIPENAPGTIHVWTSTEEMGPASIPAGYSGPYGQGSGAFVILEVKDSGCGMDEETKAKIFDPFFTTKFTGRGLGLAAVQGILRKAGGWITVDSAPQRGSLFRVVLPAARAPEPQVDIAAPSEPAMGGTAGGTILLIDDEAVVRQVARLTLERAGYRVITAEDGATGLSMLEKNRDVISLVLLDMGMPEMGGKEVLVKLRAAGITVPVVICSGYGEPEVLRQLVDCEYTAVIQKPFKAKELPEGVGRALKSVAGSKAVSR